MWSTRFASTSKRILLVTLAGFLVGCGEQSGSGPVPTKEESKKIKEEMKKSMQSFKAARSQAAQDERKGLR
jgi:hypothetical protein